MYSNYRGVCDAIDSTHLAIGSVDFHDVVGKDDQAVLRLLVQLLPLGVLGQVHIVSLERHRHSAKPQAHETVKKFD
jgi:hypothetical protein